MPNIYFNSCIYCGNLLVPPHYTYYGVIAQWILTQGYAINFISYSFYLWESNMHWRFIWLNGKANNFVRYGSQTGWLRFNQLWIPSINSNPFMRQTPIKSVPHSSPVAWTTNTHSTSIRFTTSSSVPLMRVKSTDNKPRRNSKRFDHNAQFLPPVYF